MLDRIKLAENTREARGKVVSQIKKRRYLSLQQSNVDLVSTAVVEKQGQLLPEACVCGKPENSNDIVRTKYSLKQSKIVHGGYLIFVAYLFPINLTDLSSYLINSYFQSIL